MNFPLAAVRELVSSVSKDGKPGRAAELRRLRSEWVVAADVYPVDQLEVEPRSAGPYVFGSAQEARSFVESSLVALQVLGCEVA